MNVKTINVTREVVTDLLPIYFAGEASGDTKTLVEDYFRQDPDFERVARSAATPLDTLRAVRPIVPEAETEKRDLENVRWRLQWRRVLFVVSSFLTLSPLSFYSHGPIVWRDTLWDSAFFWSLAVLSWFLYFARLRPRTASLVGAVSLTLIPVPFVSHSLLAGKPVGEVEIIVWTCAAVVWIGHFRQRSC